MDNVDYKFDLRDLPVPDSSYDVVFASHVLEHILEDTIALQEIARVLRPGGIAILPVPIVATTTIEYSSPNPLEAGHVRAPGPDYFEKYRQYFARVDVYSSDSFSDEFQTYAFEDRSQWPTRECPSRLAMPGERHLDFVPVCYV